MAKITNVKYHVLRDVKGASLAVDTASDVDEAMRENRIAFTSLLWQPEDKMLYCGITALNNDIFHRFDPSSGKFESLNYRDVAEEFEVKIHRSLCLSGDGAVYGASACLHQEDKRLEAPGGAIFRLSPGDERPEKISIPVEHDYIQTITLDDERRLIYGMTYPVFKFFVYHIDTGEVENYDYIGSITHISALDDHGCFWGTWSRFAHRLFKYDPDAKKITWYQTEIPEGRKFSDMMYPGAGPVDVMINGNDGYLYIGTTGGTLCRLDPETAKVEYLGRPAPTTRMPGLRVWRDNLLLGIAGDNEGGVVFSYNTGTGSFDILGPIADSREGLKIYRVHDLCVVDGDETVLYIAETDVPDRSGYLWECRIEDA